MWRLVLLSLRMWTVSYYFYAPYNQMKTDPINPPHYRTHNSAISCIDVTEKMDFCLGNAFKYLFRCGIKGDKLTDLEKSLWYLNHKLRHTKPSALREWWNHDYDFFSEAPENIERIVAFETRYSGWMAAAMMWIWTAHSCRTVLALVRARDAVEKMISIQESREK